MPLTVTPLLDFPLIRRDDLLADILVRSLETSAIDLQTGDIVVLAQKIVSKAEGRMVELSTVTPGARAIELGREVDKDPRLVELILRESRAVLRSRLGVIIVEHRLGFVCANAGIDRSNVADKAGSEQVLLLPEDPDRSARQIRARIESLTGLSLAVMIIDSHGRAWRNGTVGVAIGLAGVPGLVDLRGQPDLFGYTLRITQVAAADELAAAASLVMGQAAEGTPAVHVRGFPYALRDGPLSDLIRPADEDLFR